MKGKVDNKIITLPHLRKIKTKDNHGQIAVINYSNKNKERHLCTVNAGKVVLVGDSIHYKLPSHLENETQVALSSIREHQPSWIVPSSFTNNT